MQSLGSVQNVQKAKYIQLPVKQILELLLLWLEYNACQTNIH